MSILRSAAAESMWGWMGRADAAPSAVALNLNLATLSLALSFVVPADRTLSKVRVRVLSVGGTPTTASARCDIWSDDGSGSPSASLANSTTVAGAPATSTWLEFTGFSLALTKGTQYHIVVTNVDALPATNTFNVGFCGSPHPNVWIGDTQGRNGFHKRHSTTSGVTWGTLLSNIQGWRLEMSNGDFYGMPVTNITLASNSTTERVYSAREFGVKFTTPANVRMRASGAAMRFYKVGTPTGNFRYKLYKGTTLVATTLELVATRISTNTAIGGLGLAFETPITLEPSTVYRLVGSESTQSDSSSNYLACAAEYFVDNTATDKSMKPLNGNLGTTYLNGTWSDVDTAFAEFGLFLSGAGEYDVLAAQNQAFWG